jgi:hypothetical protein
MKKSVLSLLLFCLVSTGIVANDRSDNPGNGISRDALRDFAFKFFDATNVTWKITEGYQKATFILDGKNACAMYDQDGQFLMASEQVTIADLPVKVSSEISEKYPSYQIVDAVKVLGRPAGYDKQNDVGSYWTAIKKDQEVIYLLVGTDRSAKEVRKATLN